MDYEVDNPVTRKMVAEDKRMLRLVSGPDVKLNDPQRRHFAAKQRFVNKFERGDIKYWYEFYKRP